jgi:glycolate oxidase
LAICGELAIRHLQPFAKDLMMTMDLGEAARLTAVRRAALPALEKTGRVLIEDISVPRSQLPAAVLVVAAVQDAAESIFRAALRPGGIVSGEHGVGVLKRQWMRKELGREVEVIQQRLKAAFDPAGILNPGKAL